MILTFMIVFSSSVVLYRLLKNKNSIVCTNISTNSDAVVSGTDFELAYDGGSYFEDGIIRFAPPVYVQRYMVVIEKLRQLGPFRKVVDLGCSEFGFFPYLKRLDGTEELVLIDQDEELLNRRCEILKPITIDHLRPRQAPLKVKVLQGNAAVPDCSLADTSAIVAIELIEHMFPPDLDDLPFTLFGVIQPEVIIVTTPNYDFNILFENTNFRHLDHKFEWTRQQFKDWANNLVLRYPEYSAKLYGIGRGPEGSSKYGCCSQMVIFQRSLTISKSVQTFSEKSYNIVTEINYPFAPPVEISVEENVKYESEKFIYYAVDLEKYYVNDQIEIPLSHIMRMVTRHTDSQELLQTVLEDNGWTVNETASGEKCVVLPPSGISYSSSSSQSLEADDKNEGQIGFTISWDGDRGNSCIPYLSEENWDMEDNLTVPKHNGCNSSTLVDCGKTNNLDFSTELEGSHLNECKDLDKCLDDKLNVSCSSSSCEDIRHVSYLSDCRSRETEKNICKCQYPNKNEVSETNIDASSSSCNLTHSQKECIQLGNVQRDLNDKSGEPFSCYSDSPDMRKTIYNESLDRFDECHASSHSTSAKDVHSMKKSLDLPLESLKVNLNDNFEKSNFSNRKHFELKGSSVSEKCYGKIVKGESSLGTVEYNSVDSSNSNKVGTSSTNSTSQTVISKFTFDNKSVMDSDCRGRIEAGLGQNQGGINRCLSLQHIKEKEGVIKSNRFSLCCEKENINIFDIFKDGLKTKSCGHSFDEVIDLIRADTTVTLDDSCSQSKAADSGYPNTSDRDMDMDLTPEQVDELLSENESSPDEREDDEERGIGGAAPIQFLDHVENGDVANNNRDGEGNNLDQVGVGQPLHFQQLIQEDGNEVPLNEMPPHQDSDSDNEDRFISCCSFISDSMRTTDDSSVLSYEMGTCMKWMQVSTPSSHSKFYDAWPSTSLDVSSVEASTLTASSTSLVVHPSTASLSFTVRDTFPSWLLRIDIDDTSDLGNDSTSVLPEPNSFTSRDTFLDEDWSEIVIPGDLLGGGEPHTEL